MLKKEMLIEALGLEKHIEGGYFLQTYKSDLQLTNPQGNVRSVMTSIYYLLDSDSPVGHFHKNTSDIVHYYHGGDPIDYYLIDEAGSLETVTMGWDVQAGQRLQLIVPGGIWKASELCSQHHGYGLIGEAVAPGFEYEDMALGETSVLLEKFPQHQTLIKRLSR